ncbi:MAG: peptide chain release factor N(5)-glutamine methyltransferase [Gammaproteobacteria bacterium]
MSPSIASVLAVANVQLSTVTDVPQLEAEILLGHVLKASRAYLHTWPEKILENSQYTLFLDLLNRRKLGEPIAYLIGHREFWSLDLRVAPCVLIPRPETELLVELVLKSIENEQAVIADLGTGSGAIALALAYERPNWTIHATDISLDALEIAKINAAEHQLANIVFHQGKWCDALPQIKFDAIVSNPPYITSTDPHLHQGDLRFEPKGALVSDGEGLQDIQQIILTAKNYLQPGGLLFLEHGFQQAENILSIFKKAGYTFAKTHQDLADLDRVTIATWMCF